MRFVEEDNWEAVKIGELEKNSEIHQGGQAQCQQNDLPRCEHPRSGSTDGSNGRGGNVAHLHRHLVSDKWRQQLGDEDWHTVCQAIYRGVDGAVYLDADRGANQSVFKNCDCWTRGNICGREQRIHVDTSVCFHNTTMFLPSRSVATLVQECTLVHVSFRGEGVRSKCRRYLTFAVICFC